MKTVTKLFLLAGTALLSVCIVIGVALYFLNASLIDSRRSEVVNLLTKANHVVTYYRDQQTAGKLTQEQAQSQALNALQQMNAGTNSYYWANNANAITILHPNPAIVGTRSSGNRTTSGMSDVDAYRQALATTQYPLVNLLVQRGTDPTPVPKLQGLFLIPDWNWQVGTGFFYDDINVTFWRLARMLIGISVLVAFGVGATAWLIARNIQRTLGGEPNNAAAFASEIANGNLSVDVTLDAKDRSSLMFALSQMKVKLRDVVHEIQQSSNSIATGSNEIAQGNTDLSSRTEEQAASLQQTAASMEQLTATVKMNADNAQQGSQLAVMATDATQRGGDAVNEVIGTMRNIAEESRKIEQIISVIESIAFQTNILALNAAVEAARAGEEGRGFAVVAGEVRTLAQRSATAAKDIKGLIQSSVARVDAGTNQVAVAGERMSDIIQSIRRVSDIMGEIAAASSEQSVGIEQVNRAVSQMDEVTQQNAALVEQAAAAAASLDQQADRLRETVAVFRLP